MKKQTSKRPLGLRLAAAAAALFMLTACTPGFSGGSDRVLVYYAVSQKDAQSADVIRAEAFLPPEDPDDLTAFLIGKLLSTPESDGLSSLFPSDASLISWSVSGQLMTVTLGGSFAELPDVDITILQSCAVMTLCQIPRVEAVQLSFPNAGYTTRAIGEDDLVLTDLSLQPIEQNITLYFPDKGLRYIGSEQHQLIVRENEQLERYVAEEFLNGPRTAWLLDLIPEGTTLLSVITQERVCYLNLSKEFVSGFSGGFDKARLILASLANTMTAIDNVDSLVLLCEGVKIESFGPFSISEPLTPDQDSVLAGETPANIRDITVYYPAPDQKSVAALPRNAVTRDETSDQQMAIEHLLSGTAPWWSYPPLAEKTRIVSLTILEGRCTITFSSEFYSALIGTDGLLNSVYCVAATLTEFPSISSVVVLAEGADASGDVIGHVFTRGDIPILQ